MQPQLYVHVLEPIIDETNNTIWIINAKFNSVLDALDYYEYKKKHCTNCKLIIVDTYHKQQVDTF